MTIWLVIASQTALVILTTLLSAEELGSFAVQVSAWVSFGLLAALFFFGSSFINRNCSGNLITMQPGLLSPSRLRSDYATFGCVWLGFLRGGLTSFLTSSLPASHAGNCAVRLPSWRVVATTRSNLRHDDGIAAGEICHGDWILTRIRW